VRVVFDTNVLLAAILAEGLCSKLLHRARQREIESYVCPSILDELQAALRSNFSTSALEVRDAVGIIADAVSETVEPEEQVAAVCRDRRDDHVLACARAAGADYLVTGDADLLVLEEFSGARIIRPRDLEDLFLD